MKKDIIVMSLIGLFLIQSAYPFSPTAEQIENTVLLQNKNIIASQISTLSQDELANLSQRDSEAYLLYVQDFVKKTKLADILTRREMMKIILNLSWESINSSCRWDYSDVNTNDWGCKYIETAAGLWYISPSDVFRPDDSTTKIEALKLVLKSQSIEKIIETDNWQRDYVETAFAYGIIDEVFTDYNAQPNRAWIFNIAATTLIQNEAVKFNSAPEKLMSDEAF